MVFKLILSCYPPSTILLDDIGTPDHNFPRHGLFPFSSKLRYVGDIPSILAIFLRDIAFSSFLSLAPLRGVYKIIMPGGDAVLILNYSPSLLGTLEWISLSWGNLLIMPD